MRRHVLVWADIINSLKEKVLWRTTKLCRDIEGFFVNGDTGGNVKVNSGSEDESAGVYSELVSRSMLFEIYDCAYCGTVVEGFEVANESFSADAQSIGHAIDVVKPRGNERDLQNALIVEADCAQTIVILLADVGRIFSQPSDVIKHHTILIRDGGGLVILLQRLHQIFI